MATCICGCFMVSWRGSERLEDPGVHVARMQEFEKKSEEVKRKNYLQAGRFDEYSVPLKNSERKLKGE